MHRCHHIALGDHITNLDHRALIDIGVLVRTGVLHQVVDIDADFTSHRLVIINPNHNAGRVDIVDRAAT